MISINLLFLCLPPFFCFHSKQKILRTKQESTFYLIFCFVGATSFLGSTIDDIAIGDGNVPMAMS